MWLKTHLPHQILLVVLEFSGLGYIVIPHPCRRIFNFYVSWDRECKVLWPTLCALTCEDHFLCSASRRAAVWSTPSGAVRGRVLSPPVLEFTQFGRGVSLAGFGRSEREQIFSHHWWLSPLTFIGVQLSCERSIPTEQLIPWFCHHPRSKVGQNLCL